LFSKTQVFFSENIPH